MCNLAYKNVEVGTVCLFRAVIPDVMNPLYNPDHRFFRWEGVRFVIFRCCLEVTSLRNWDFIFSLMNLPTVSLVEELNKCLQVVLVSQ
jgi:hypothetical protein